MTYCPTRDVGYLDRDCLSRKPHETKIYDRMDDTFSCALVILIDCWMHFARINSKSCNTSVNW